MNFFALVSRFQTHGAWRGLAFAVVALLLPAVGRSAVTLSSYLFTTDNLPTISATSADIADALASAGPNGYYKLRAKVIVSWSPGYHHAIDSINNFNSPLTSVPGTGTYVVDLYWVAYNAAGELQSIGTFNSQLIVISPPAAGGAGLKGEYFAGSVFGSLMHTAVSGETPNYDWANGGPAWTGPDNFSVRWSGNIEPLYTGTYTITAGSDDGMRVYIDDMVTPLVGDWSDHGYQETSQTVNFEAGKKRLIKVEFYEIGGGARYQLFWESSLQSRQEVPVTRLSPPSGGGGTPQAPTIVTNPQSQTVNAGTVAYFTVVVNGWPAPTYQWRKNGANIAGATGSSCTIALAQPADAGGYSVVVTNSAGSATSGTAMLTIAAGPGGTGTGNGLRGDYYNGTNFESLIATRTDGTVNFDWPGSPIAGVGADYFSVRWSGQVEAPTTGYYTFSTNSDDGVRLKVNAVTVINDWNPHPPIDNFSGQVYLTAGSKTDLVLEYFENAGGASIQLFWQPPGQGSRELIPGNRLYSTLPPGGGTGWQTLAAVSRTFHFTEDNGNWLAQAEDHYFTIPDSGTLRIFTTGSADTLGRLYASDWSVSLGEVLDYGGVGGNFRLERAINAGSYVLRVEGRYQGNADEDYTAYVEFLPTTVATTLPTITSSDAASGTVGSEFSGYTATATGTAPMTYSATNLPSGLGINASNGSISGTPTLAGTIAATVIATNTVGSNSKAVTFTIAASPGGGASAATGGSVTRVGDYLVHTFTGSGTFSLPSTRTCDVLVVAGGGGGGQGGGGAGGFSYVTGQSVPAGSHAVAVGNGGAASSPWSTGNDGVNSQFGSLLVAHGGGGGGGIQNRGTDGGSGGGAGRDANNSGGSAVWGSEGNAGGGAPSDGWCSSGGGGGAGGAGGSGNSFVYTDDKGGDGGNGRSCDITGSSMFYAGGGGGTNESGGGALPVGGVGGGGAGSRSYQYGVSGTNGLGGGGGAGAAGGSGVVIVRYYSPLVTGTAPTITSGSTVSGTVGSAFSGYTVTTSGTTPMTLTFSVLPPGLSFNPASGAVTGAPTAAGSYSVQFTATNVAGVSSKTVTFIIVAIPVPTNLRPIEIGSAYVALAWDAPGGGFAIDHYEISNGSGPVAIAGGNQTSFLWSGLSYSTTYTFKVRAVSTDGSPSNWTTMANVATTSLGVPSGASRWIDLARTDSAGGSNYITSPPDGIRDELIGVDQNRFAASVVQSSWSYPFNDFWTLWGIFWPDGTFTPNFNYALMMQPYWDYDAPPITSVDVDVSFQSEPSQVYAILVDDSEGHEFHPENVIQHSLPTSFPNAERQHLITAIGIDQLQFAKFYLVRYGMPIGSLGFGNLPGTMTPGAGTITLPGLGTVTTHGTGSVRVPAGGSAILSVKDAVGKVIQTGPQVIWEIWDLATNTKLNIGGQSVSVDFGVDLRGNILVGAKLDEQPFKWFIVEVKSDVTFITPAGDPVNTPVEAGGVPADIPDGANEFTYSSELPDGVLTVKLKARVRGLTSVTGDERAKYRFAIPTDVGDSEMEWAYGNEFGRPMISGDILEAMVRFKKLPTFTSAFGPKTAQLLYNGSAVAEQAFEVFFPAFSSNHPGAPSGSPNWFYYWLQTTANKTNGAPTATHLGEDSFYDFPPPLPDRIVIGERLLEKSFPIWGSPKGIDAFAWITAHEAKHRSQMKALWPGGYDGSRDNDSVDVPYMKGKGDDIPDTSDIPGNSEADYMPGRVYNPTKWATYEDSLGYGQNPIPDREDINLRSRSNPDAIDQLWNNGAANDKDWSNPGKNSKDGTLR